MQDKRLQPFEQRLRWPLWGAVNSVQICSRQICQVSKRSQRTCNLKYDGYNTGKGIYLEQYTRASRGV